MKKLIAIFLICSFALHAAPDSRTPAPISDIHAAPTSVVNQVNVISGSYQDVIPLVQIDGPTPLVWEERYNSMAANPMVRFSGWNDNHPSVADRYLIPGDPRRVDFSVERSDGSVQQFHKPNTFGSQSLAYSPAGAIKGITNLSSEIGGRTDCRNTVLKSDRKGDHATLYEENGKIREYGKCKRKDRLLLKRELQSDGNQFVYDHGSDLLLKQITARTAGGTEYGWIKPNPFWYRSVHKVQKMHIPNSSGYSAAVTYLESGLYFKVIEIESRLTPKITFEYDKGSAYAGPRVKAKKYPDGRRQAIAYYQKGSNQLRNGTVSVKLSDQRMDRVMQRLAPVGTTDQLMVTEEFVYDEVRGNREAPAGGVTSVYDAYGNRTRYVYNDRHYVTDVERFDGSKRISHQQLSWSSGNREGRLMSNILMDGQGGKMTAEAYTYDARGNVLTKSFEHRFRGSAPDEFGTHVIEYEHQNDLVVAEHHPSGRSVRYTYAPGTNLVASKRMYDGSTLVERQFYTYADGGILVREESDDGCSEDPQDFTGVHVRTIRVIEPKLSGRGFGKPETVSEYYWQEGEQHLLSRTHTTYDQLGNPIVEERYGADGQLAYTQQWSYDQRGRVTAHINPEGYTTTYSYDANDNVVHTTGPRPHETHHFKYDFSNRLIAETIEYEGSSWTRHYAYDLKGNRTMESDFHGREVHHSYDAAGNAISTVLPGSRQPTKMSYDALGQLTTSVDPDGYVTSVVPGVREKPLRITHADDTEEWFDYDSEGNLIEQRHQDGSLTRFTRDALGRERVVTRLDADGQQISEVQHRYEGSLLVESKDTEGNRTFFSYDGAGRLVSKSIDDETIAYEYDALGRRTRTVYADRIEVEIRDHLDRVIETRLEGLDGTIYRQHQTLYDEVGNKVYEIDTVEGGQAITELAYDGLGRLLSKTDPMGDTTSYHYDDLKYQVVETDPIGRVVITQHDEQGRVSSVEKLDPYGVRIAHMTREYDERGNLTTESHAILKEGETTGQYQILRTYGPKNRVESVSENSERTTHYVYDWAGRLAVTKLPDGKRLFREYDGLSRLSNHHSSDRTIDYTYHYDHRDQLIQVDDNIHQRTTYRAYDTQGRMVMERLDTGHTMSQLYNSAGRIGRVEVGGETVDYTYDPIGPSRIHWRDFRYKVRQRDAAGYIGIERSGAYQVAYQHDAMGRLVQVDSEHYSFDAIDGYDHVGRIDRYHETYGGKSVSADFGYSHLNHMVHENNWNRHRYDYDSLGNRLQHNDDQYEVDSLNQLTSDGRIDYTYDEAGRLSSKAGRVHYSYDALGRLLQITDEQRTISYTYDAFNRRLSKHVVGPDLDRYEEYLYWGRCEVGSVRDGQLQDFRVLRAHTGSETGQSIAILFQGKQWTPQQDYRGNIIGLIREDGLHHMVRYSAFGQTERRSAMPWSFSGKRHDPETGYVNFGVRYYDPSIGRWATPDPKGYIDGPNLYAYVSNCPLTLMDAWGEYGMGPNQGFTFLNKRLGYPGRMRQSIHDSRAEFDRKIAHNRKYGYPYLDYVGGDDLSGKHILFINGMNNTRDKALGTMRVMSESAGGARVYGVIWESHIIPGGDLVICGLRKMRMCQTAAKVAAEFAREVYKSSNGRATISGHYHSGGAIVASQMVEMLDKKVLMTMYQHTYGGGSRLVKGDGRTVVNYIAVNPTEGLMDFVPIFSAYGRGGVVDQVRRYGKGYSEMAWQEDVVLVAQEGTFQHGIMSDTYRRQLTTNVRGYAAG